MKKDHHPAAALFPMMPAAELQQLAEDIKTNGQREPILLLDDLILDGRNRQAACELAGVEPCYEQAHVNSGTPAAFVISLNLHRRHLNTSQRAAVVARIREAELARPSCSITKTPKCRSFIAIAATELNVSPESAYRAVRVLHEDPAEFERIERGATTVNQAFKKVETTKPAGRRLPLRAALRRHPAPPSHGTKKRAQYEQATKRRMIEGLSQIRGLCRGLWEMNLDLLLPALDQPERRTWAKIATECARILSDFHRQLEIPNGSSSTSQKTEIEAD
jgi:hypothetical protein